MTCKPEEGFVMQVRVHGSVTVTEMLPGSLVALFPMLPKPGNKKRRQREGRRQPEEQETARGSGEDETGEEDLDERMRQWLEDGARGGAAPVVLGMLL